MKNKDNISNELEMLGASVLNGLPKHMPFSIPSNYFSTFNNEVISNIQLAEMADIVPEWSKEFPLIAPPAHYFEELSDNIIDAIKTEELLHALPKENPYQVPVNYFEQFTANVLEQVKVESKKGVTSPKRIPLFRTFQLAASVALVVCTGLGIMRYNTYNQLQNMDLSSVSNTAISEYIDQNIDDFDTDLIVTNVNTDNVSTVKNTDFSNEEIKQYLNEDGWN
jgi:hypothetical protein